jgi:hypothetical protein
LSTAVKFASWRLSRAVLKKLSRPPHLALRSAPSPRKLSVSYISLAGHRGYGYARRSKRGPKARPISVPPYGTNGPGETKSRLPLSRSPVGAKYGPCGTLTGRRVDLRFIGAPLRGLETIPGGAPYPGRWPGLCWFAPLGLNRLRKNALSKPSFDITLAAGEDALDSSRWKSLLTLSE